MLCLLTPLVENTSFPGASAQWHVLTLYCVSSACCITERGLLAVYRRYQGSRPQPPGAAELLADMLLGVRVRKSILGHSMLSQVSSTKPPVSPELAFQHLCSKHSARRTT